jgi:hypothetical protein
LAQTSVLRPVPMLLPALLQALPPGLLPGLEQQLVPPRA